MKNQIALLATIGIVFLFIIGLNLESPTGFITGNYAKTVNSHVTDFFSITGIAFPPNECGKIVKELYDDFAFVPTDTTVGFESSGVKTLNFVVDRTERYGTIDMARGLTIVGNEGADSAISINAESIVRVPKTQRFNFLAIELYGLSKDRFFVTHGAFSTPGIDCVFDMRSGQVCDCDVHRIRDIRISGITAPMQSYTGQNPKL